MKKRLKTILAPVIVAATIAAFAYYVNGHPETIDQLKRLPPATIFVLLALNVVAFFSYVVVTRAALHICRKTMSRQENILFNAYSSLINFFGPGQSGPVFRAAYLKKRHNLSIKQFTFTLLLYSGFFAVVSAMLMLVGSRPWWQTAVVMIAVGAGSFWFIRRYERRSHIDIEGGLTPLNLGWMFGAIVLQVATLAVVYGIELQQVGANASVGEILSYTGVSNFSLFVALTPGAIGIREAFLVFSQSLHHIDTTTIVAANILDRAAYLLFLGILFVFVLALHAKDKLHVKELGIGKN